MLEQIRDMKALIDKRIMNEKDILANIFLNYSSVEKNDIIYLLKKELSLKLKVDIKDIRLIGSGHTGFSLDKKNKIIKKKNPKDLDFVIINEIYFEKIKREIEEQDAYLEGSPDTLIYPIFIDSKKVETYRDIFEKNLRKGKLHLRYIKQNFKLIRDCRLISGYLKAVFEIKLKISCCIYRSEKEFLENQYRYYREGLVNYLEGNIEK
ncbi:hypothetical protein I6E36_04300 [Fusobacterium mortiferum]|uniref:hypothetical protein n=1 Tax=Fusobacterium mortiferum TaxID=850 RepID=UPI001F2E0E9C|nr:hypothetical protein [Fusobacterium mortiferum]MCF2627299.1 hypothetical protein [Fusobacterium mortiferum]